MVELYNNELTWSFLSWSACGASSATLSVRYFFRPFIRTARRKATSHCSRFSSPLRNRTLRSRTLRNSDLKSKAAVEAITTITGSASYRDRGVDAWIGKRGGGGGRLRELLRELTFHEAPRVSIAEVSRQSS